MDSLRVVGGHVLDFPGHCICVVGAVAKGPFHLGCIGQLTEAAKKASKLLGRRGDNRRHAPHLEGNLLDIGYCVRHRYPVGAPEFLERIERAQSPSTRNSVRSHRVLYAGKALLEGLARLGVLGDLRMHADLLAMDVDGELRRLLEDRDEAIQDRRIRVNCVKIPREGTKSERLALHEVVQLDLHRCPFLGVCALQHFGQPARPAHRGRHVGAARPVAFHRRRIPPGGFVLKLRAHLEPAGNCVHYQAHQCERRICAFVVVVTSFPPETRERSWENPREQTCRHAVLCTVAWALPISLPVRARVRIALEESVPRLQRRILVKTSSIRAGRVCALRYNK